MGHRADGGDSEPTGCIDIAGTRKAGDRRGTRRGLRSIDPVRASQRKIDE